MEKERDYVEIAKQYARDVISGEKSACEWVRAACQRFLNDLERQLKSDFKYRFDKEKAWRVCFFIEQLPHIKGRWKVRNVILEPWQCFALANIFGWLYKESDLRRFRKALVVIPAKNGKSFLAAAIGLYMLALDNEPGAEVYSAATTRDQAKIVWDTAKKMVQKCPDFGRRFGIEALAHSIVIESEASYFKPLSRDSDTMEGINPNCVIIDELHAHRTREVFDVLDERTGARSQPLTFIISTEGDNPTGVFAEQVEYAHQILSGRHQDDSYWAVIYSLDAADDWTARESWYKANPNLGVSVFEQDVEERCRRAQKNPASQSSFLTKRLNVRVGAGEAYFNMLAWRTLCKDESLSLDDFVGEPCWIGLDLANKNDIAAKVMLFRKDNKYVVFGTYYLPEDIIERGNPNYDVYRGWDQQKFLTLTPGNTTDFDFIERDLVEDKERFEITEVDFDPFQARQLATRMLAEGLNMVEIGQTVRNLSEPMKEIASLISQGRLLHNGDPVLDWQMANVMAKVDAKENVYPRKPRPEAKIDAPVALIMAKSREMVSMDSGESVYATRSIRFIGA